ncbi:MAG: histone [Candidatus Woesearchaeota archaeon]
MGNIISSYACKNLFKEQGAQRVADTACDELDKILEKRIRKIARRARLFARHANRKTILESDMQLALEEFEHE